MELGPLWETKPPFVLTHLLTWPYMSYDFAPCCRNIQIVRHLNNAVLFHGTFLLKIFHTYMEVLLKLQNLAEKGHKSHLQESALKHHMPASAMQLC